MGDVAMMADPIEQLTAARVVVPAPILMETALDVRLPMRGAQPEIIIQLGRRLRWHHFLAGVRKVRVAGWKSDFDMGDLADQAVAYNFCRLAEGSLGTLPGAGLPDAFVLADGFDDGLLFGDRARQRFLAVD